MKTLLNIIVSTKCKNSFSPLPTCHMAWLIVLPLKMLKVFYSPYVRSFRVCFSIHFSKIRSQTHNYCHMLTKFIKWVMLHRCGAMDDTLVCSIEWHWIPPCQDFHSSSSRIHDLRRSSPPLHNSFVKGIHANTKMYRGKNIWCWSQMECLRQVLRRSQFLKFLIFLWHWKTCMWELFLLFFVNIV